MNRSLALVLAFTLAGGIFTAQNAAAQGAATGPQCNDFIKLRDDAQAKAMAVRNATLRKVDRKELCTLTERFFTAEGVALKFLQQNKTWCGIPDEAVKAAKTGHERTLKFRTAACSEAPGAQPKAPTLSDAIGTPSVDSAANTKTGRGTLDTLSGNPLAK